MRSLSITVVATLLAALAQAPLHAQVSNLALTGTASQSTTSHANAPASDAIDGNTDGYWYNDSVTHTLDQPGSWWEVMLPAPQVIDEIVLWNRSDCCGDRLSNFRLSVFQGTTEVWGNHFFPNNLSWVSNGRSFPVYPPPSILGDRIRIELQGINAKGDNVLSLAEVEVLQYGPLPIANIAPLGEASQSSLSAGGLPQRAVDGISDGHYPNGSVSHTSNLPNSWWQVELASRHDLERIRIFNRADCCADRLSNFRLSVFDGTVEVFGQNFYVGTGHVPAGGVESVDLPAGTTGDRVRIEIQGLGNTSSGVLSLAEVEVLRSAAGLRADPRKLSIQTGGAQTWSIWAGRQYAQYQFLALGSITGTWPGLQFSGTSWLPLNFDGYFMFSLNSPNLPPFTNSLGLLDHQGRAEAGFTIPSGLPPILVGATFYHAYLVFDSSLNIVTASNASVVLFDP